MTKSQKKEIPEAIKEAFAFESANFKGKIERLGVKHGVEWFHYELAEPLEIGLPVIYGLDKGEIIRKYEFEALDIIGSFIKD